MSLQASASGKPLPAELIVVSAGEEGLVFELTVPDFELQPGSEGQHYSQLLNVPGLDQSLEGGKPQLPLKGVMIGVPVDAEFTLTVLEDEKVVLKDTYDIQPVGIQERMSDEFQPGTVMYQPDEGVYSSSRPYPAAVVSMAQPAWIREQRVLQVSVFPFQYLPAEKTLIWHKHLKISINFIYNHQTQKITASKLDNGNPIETSPFETIYQSQLLNYEAARDWRTAPSLISQWGDSTASISGGFDQTQSLGPRYKIVVDQDGIYRITRNELNAVHSVGGIDINKLIMSNQGRKVAYMLENDNGNDTFDEGESILFYGQKFYGNYLAEMYSSEDDLWLTYIQQLPNGKYTAWKPTMNAVMMEKYTDDNIYWLTIGDDSGWMPTVDGSPQDINPVAETYTTTVKAEQSHHWYTWNFSSEDTWYWESIRDENPLVFTTTLSALASVPFTATLEGEAVAQVRSNTYLPDHHNKIWINSEPTPLVDECWDGISRYHFSAELPSSRLREGENSLIYEVLFDAYDGQNSDWIYFDWFSIEYSRTFRAVNNLLQFSRDEGGSNWQYEINNFSSSEATVLDITRPLTPTHILNPRISSGIVSFEGQAHSGEAQYIVAGDAAIQIPKTLSYYTPPTPDLYDSGNQTDYLFITHNAFLEGVQSLADYRTDQGLSTQVIDFNDLVDEFNFGIYNPIAIKNFLRYTFAHWQKPSPSYVILVGDGHWNFKNYSGEYGTQTIYMPPFLAWVDPEQGEVDATNDLATIVGTDALPDLSIGRLPVTNTTELDNYIQKVMVYEASPIQEWQNHFLFVADDTPDPAGNFPKAGDYIIDNYLSSGYTPDRLYLDDYVDVQGLCSQSGDHKCIEATRDFINTLNEQGELVVNYIGHGWNTFWASEVLFTKADVDSLSNGDKLPILLSLTCKDGYWYHPGTTSNDYGYETSLAEAFVRAEQKGMVGTFSPSGLGNIVGHEALLRGFYDGLINNGVHELGVAALAAKIKLASMSPNSDQIHTYLVIGDPALQIQINRFVFLPTVFR